MAAVVVFFVCLAIFFAFTVSVVLSWGLLAVLPLLLSVLTALLLYRRSPAGKRVSVLVLGDIGRSPRMQYHAISLAKEGFDVDLVGFSGSKPHQGVLNNKRISQHFLPEPPTFPKVVPRFLHYILKAVFQSVQLLAVLLVQTEKPAYLLVQNPPAIPTLAIAWLVCLLRGTRFLIDWHNYGYTILGLALSPKHPLLMFSKWYEGFFGTLSSGNLCVTNAMKKDLLAKWGIRAVTMYDRPPLIFRSFETEEQHELFCRLRKEYPVFGSRSGEADSKRTAFTEETEDGTVRQIADRPALLVSSTSWTEDEDFSILLNALEVYEKSAAEKGCQLPDLICAITGKGPQKEYYQGLIAKKKFQHVQICTPWLAAEDYPKLLGSADLGVCLHYSSSGLDLPMKVVDMFGCGLPVCAIHFNCLHELVKHEENGLVFHNEEQLAKQIQDLLDGFPVTQGKLKTFRDNLQSFQSLRWDQCWKDNVLPLLKH
ncbi:PREDICTED: chitobiosyldiphosphodolichol beta-mannosyltransferase-like [Branchiostoma belcheri]|uniref:Chitobiosyldiphosphodolichol beta-mannosyltransferase n=1 Tax=Branchiostoma belcheri TaxID=7741 RepID=A0A6P5A732_BRABE|nr:PREDICTED: chitobiosyldiphosphodolichol beta-mannosyltransferase-like [Branchiostoma belcheri]